MINTILAWYLLIPLFLSAISIFIFKRYVFGINWRQAVGAAVIGLLISSVIMSVAFYVGKGSKTADVEILNGQVLSKDRNHGHYLRSYSCNCRQTCNSNNSCTTTCDTCYEDRYTVNWSCYTTIGEFTIEHLDRGSRSVYNTPDPHRYTIIQSGDPVSRTHNYTNYIKAVPDTLFRPAEVELRERFADMIPEYPGQVYDIYKIDRVLGVDVNIPNLREWNDKLSEVLKTLGPLHQANAVIVIVNTDDPNYFFALQDAWLNGKKNDVVLVIGAPNFPAKASWVRVMALTEDEIFQVKLRDRILALDELTADSVISALSSEVTQTFKRKAMASFAYLDAEIDPPAWVMIICTLLIIGAYAGFWVFTYKHRDQGGYNQFGVPRFRRW